jgi:hypothetical protein
MMKAPPRDSTGVRKRNDPSAHPYGRALGQIRLIAQDAAGANVKLTGLAQTLGRL